MRPNRWMTSAPSTWAFTTSSLEPRQSTINYSPGTESSPHARGDDMKAIRIHQYGPPEVMKLEDVPEPQPDSGQVVVKLQAIGVNPVETYIRSGTYAVKPPLPYTPGSDAAGVVCAVGEEVTQYRVHDRVYT